MHSIILTRLLLPRKYSPTVKFPTPPLPSQTETGQSWIFLHCPVSWIYSSYLSWMMGLSDNSFMCYYPFI